MTKRPKPEEIERIRKQADGGYGRWENDGSWTNYWEANEDIPKLIAEIDWQVVENERLKVVIQRLEAVIKKKVRGRGCDVQG